MGDGELSLVAQGRNDVTGDQLRYCCIRPEAIEIGDQIKPHAKANIFEGTVTKTVNLGAYIDVWISIGAQWTLKASIASTQAHGAGSGARIKVSVAPERIQVLPA